MARVRSSKSKPAKKKAKKAKAAKKAKPRRKKAKASRAKKAAKTRTQAKPVGSAPAGACPLTGLPKGDAARQVWSAALDGALAQGDAAVLALIDVDDFGRHARELEDARADALLVAVAERLQGALDVESLGRLAGDVFGAVLVGVEVERALGLLDRAREAVSKSPIRVGRGVKKRQVPLSVSAGVASLRRDAGDLRGLLQRAEGALWRAKGLGGDRVGLPARDNMGLKTSYYAQHQLTALKRLADRTGLKESVLLREALEDLLLKYKDRRDAP